MSIYALGDRKPSFGEGSWIAHNATVIGSVTAGRNVNIWYNVVVRGDNDPITIGDDSRIGANAVVVKSIPANSVVVGVPGQIVKRSQPHLPTDAPDLDHASLPDVIGVTLKDLMSRVNDLEAQVDGHSHEQVHEPVDDAWQEADFMI